LALDLGCGPGHTTRLLASTTGAETTVGLDTSETFLARARAGAPDGITFLRHDVTDVPFPTPPADLVYSRMVLSHVPRPDRVVAAWIGQLEQGGVLALDEVEWIRTDDPVLARYLELLDAVLAARGGVLAVGPLLEGLNGGPGAKQRTSRVRLHPVSTAVAAELFGLNLATWRDDSHARAHHTSSELDDLDAQLQSLTRRPGRAEITWGMRQMTFERTR